MCCNNVTINKKHKVHINIYYICINIYIYIFILFVVRSPQGFRQSAAPGALSILVRSVVLYSLTRTTMISPGKDETRVCGYIKTYEGYTKPENLGFCYEPVNLPNSIARQYQRRIKSPVEPLGWHSFTKTVNGLKVIN